MKTTAAGCLGLQMKIIKNYPNTCQQLMDSVLTLPKELAGIKCLNAYEFFAFVVILR